MRSRWNKALPWKHYTKLMLHQLVHLLQIKYVNAFREMQQLWGVGILLHKLKEN